MTVKIELIEKCNQKIAKYVLNHIDEIDYRIIDDVNYDPKEKFIEYLNKVISTKNGHIKVTYTNKDDGRMFVKGYAIQNMLREFRHSLFDNNCYDIDIKNAHPVILEQYCKKLKIPHSELKEYNKKRDTIILNLINQGFTKDEIKQALLKIMNGGKLDDKFVQYFEELNDELKTIRTMILKHNPELEKIVKKEKKFNIEGSVLNLVLCQIENKIITSAMEFFQKNNYYVMALCFDGLMIEKTKDITKDILISLNQYVKKSTEYEVEFLIKPMNEGLKIDMNEINEIKDDIIIETDEEGANYIIKHLNNKIIKSNGRVFIKKFDDANIYYEDESSKFSNTKDLLLNVILKMSIKKQIKSDAIVDYSKNIGGAKALVEATFVLIENDDDFINKTWNSNIKKLCFLNGYYDFNDKVFKKYDDSTYTTVYINLNYNNNVSDQYVNLLNDKIINKILYNKEIRDSFLNWCSRGLAGLYTDKTWSVGLGLRNSGKSVLTELFLETFNTYCGTFTAEELICNRVGNGDVAKKLAWLLPFEFRRLNFSNELKSVDDTGKPLKLDGNLIKSVSSGGDTKKARRNYKDEVSFKIQGRMCLFMNDLIKTDPNDAIETLTIFEFKSIFKDEITENEQIINNQENCQTKYFLKDDTIKQLIKNDNIKHALIKIIIDNYTDNPQINKNADEFIDNDNNLILDIKNIYDITFNCDDKMTVSDFNDYNKEHLSQYTKSKIKQIISSLGASEKVIKIDKKTVRFYTGIKLKNNN